MIQLHQPSMAFNSHDTWCQARMWNTRRVEPTVTPREIAEAAVAIAATSPTRKLANVVFSCHGEPGHLRVGTGIRLADLDTFAAWRGKVGAIWMHACLVGRAAASSPLGFMAPHDNGAVFCSSFALVTGCKVVASADIQALADWGQAILPIGQLDQFEGRVAVWGPDGRIASTQALPFAISRGGSRFTGNSG